ncbi:MAG TPA: TonB-dependent receptor [Bryobacteraceae bacterium]|nr:TonB-dependent receptor [Bryobacteraceae bacterium]
MNKLYMAAIAICVLFFGGLTFAQSTASITGTIVDATGAPIPGATVTIHNLGTGEEHVAKTDTSGIYLVTSLPVGRYRVESKSQGMRTAIANGVELAVGVTLRQDFTMQIAATSDTVEVTAASPLVDSTTSTLGDVVNQRTVQEVPLNGRHFIDLSYLTVGTVTPPVNGFLTAPLRGQGSFSFNSAGAREDSVNFMINGINLSDPNQNQITFQPTINTVEEFKIDNSTFSAEYGRNSGSIVNIATRSGENRWHGEAYEFLRNDWFDARNFTNPTFVTVGGALVPNPENQFIRNQFGGDGGGAIIKNKLFAFFSYEGLRQRQAVALSATVPTVAQRATATDPIIQKLLPLIPLPNSGTSAFVGAASAPVNIEQGTVNVGYALSDKHRLNFYYATQRDERNEPPPTDGNSFPGGGDQRNGNRQLLTFNEIWSISPTLTNEFRLGGNRIHITFAGDNTDSATAFGINSGVTAAIGLPQMSVSGAFTFGGIGGFPQGRGDNVGSTSDTFSWVKGNHIIKMGGEFRRQNSDNFSYTPGTFGFPSITAFLADQANSFSVTNANRSNRTYGSSLGAFITDSWKVTPSFTVSLGLRYDWYGTPTEAENRFVVFDPTTVTLQNVGRGGPSNAYQQSALNFQPRVGIVFDPFHNGKTVIRSSYAIMTDQPTLGLVTGLAANPPNAFPVSYTPPAGSFVTLANAFPLANGAVSPVSVAHSYHDAYFSEWNFNVEQEFAHDYALSASYVGTKGTDLNIERNYNQLVNGVRPFPRLSASSPIDPGVPLTNIGVYESDGNSSYQALWLTVKKRVSKGLQFQGNYQFSKSIDDNSRNIQGIVLQDSNNIAGDRGLSDFDARHRFVLSGIYAMPFFERNRFLGGWELSLIQTLQSGNPLNFHTTNTSFLGTGTLRPNVTGNVITGFTPSTIGSPTQVTYIQNPSVFVDQGAAFGNLGRNVVIGPGFVNTDMALVKNFKLTEGGMNIQLRADAYDLFNHANLTSPVTTVGSTLGRITGGTRVPTGDGGSSRQLQLALKFQF